MRKIVFILTILFLLQCAYSEETYDSSADALVDIKSAIALAKETDKHVFVKVGGNWCGWCKLYAKHFGFPVFVIIDGDGNVLHIQDSALLEEGKGYSKNHVMRFLSVWTADAVDPSRVSAE